MISKSISTFRVESALMKPLKVISLLKEIFTNPKRVVLAEEQGEVVRKRFDVL